MFRENAEQEKKKFREAIEKEQDKRRRKKLAREIAKQMLLIRESPEYEMEKEERALDREIQEYGEE